MKYERTLDQPEIRALKEEGLLSRYIVISTDEGKRVTADGIEIYP